MSFQRAGTVRKVRLVENRDGGAHLLPISLPAIPAGLEWSVSEEELLSAMDPSVLPQVQRLFARPPEGDREVFLRNALVSSLIPLSWALRDLAEALPSSAMSAVREDRLRHLVVTYPGLSVGTLALLLRSVLHNAVRMASDSGMASLVHDSVPALDWLGLDDLGDANALLHAIAFIVDDRLLDCTEPAGLHHLGAYGITHTELLAIGGRLGLSIARTSGLLDLLIERAMISTKIGRLPNGELTRLYKPDGELTTDRLRMERRVSV
ncbi:MAG: hypothetical protein KDA37_10705 [Planctomycetales bacterium]|nr:hypothetical protein [Planctomycetales bacterium]